MGRTEQVEGSFAGYNIYRAKTGEPLPWFPLNSELVMTDVFVDTGLERGVMYTYVARAVVRMPAGSLVESSASAEGRGQLLDE